MKITQTDVITAAYIFTLIGALTALLGGLLVYSVKKSKVRKAR